jgi:hypothetical protein
MEPVVDEKEARARPEILLKSRKFKKFHSKYTMSEREETQRHVRLLSQHDRLNKEARAEFDTMINR